MSSFNTLKKLVNLRFFIVLSITLVLISLGNWQLERLEEKESFITKIKHNTASPPRQIGENDTLELYDKIELRGHFLNDVVFLYGRRSAYPEKDGYYLLSTFKDTFGNIYLVSRAWLSQSIKNEISSIPSQSEEIITTFVMQGEVKKFFMPDNDSKNNIWFTIDLEEAKNKLGITNQNFYLMQLNANDLPTGFYPLTSNYLAVVRNDHLEYAITWYCLAALLLLMYFLYHKKSISNLS